MTDGHRQQGTGHRRATDDPESYDPARGLPEPIPPDLFLSGYAPDIRDLAEELRSVVHEAVPEAIERVRTGWRLIGYDVPAGRRTRYFAFVAPGAQARPPRVAVRHLDG